MAKFGFNLAELRLVTPDFILQNPELAESPLDYALRYVALGWWVLPCDREKRPLPGHSLLTATNNPARVRAIWTQHPEAGVAVSCARSGLVVMDVDPRNGGYETLARLGYAGLRPAIVPAPWLLVFPSGPALSEQAALAAPTAGGGGP